MGHIIIFKFPYILKMVIFLSVKFESCIWISPFGKRRLMASIDCKNSFDTKYGLFSFPIISISAELPYCSSILNCSPSLIVSPSLLFAPVCTVCNTEDRALLYFFFLFAMILFVKMFIPSVAKLPINAPPTATIVNRFFGPPTLLATVVIFSYIPRLLNTCTPL